MQWTINTSTENITHTSGLKLSFKNRVFINTLNIPKRISSWEIDNLINEAKKIYMDSLSNQPVQHKPLF